MTDYPLVLAEEATLRAALAGRSLARFGDGELSIALGGDCVSQKRDPQLSRELRAVLAGSDVRWMACIPNCKSTSRPDGWAKYAEPRYTALYKQGIYGSSFITRPDSACWIDTPAYWSELAGLWRDRDVVLVKGTERSLRADQLVGANKVTEVGGPRRDAYAEIDRIEEEIGKPSCPVLLCLGPAATVLAVRLARKGVHAIDLGHIGMFMRHAGSYRYAREDLLTNVYKRLLEEQHRKTSWGNDGGKHVDIVHELVQANAIATVLDYGCGEGALARTWKEKGYLATGVRIMEYDPGMPGKDGMPKPVDMTVCTDVLEHVEPDKIDAVLDHIFNVTGKLAYLVISTKAAKAVLSDGRNAHLIIQDWAWWSKKLVKLGWRLDRLVVREGKDVSVCLTKR